MGCAAKIKQTGGFVSCRAGARGRGGAGNESVKQDEQKEAKKDIKVFLGLRVKGQPKKKGKEEEKEKNKLGCGSGVGGFVSVETGKEQRRKQV